MECPRIMSTDLDGLTCKIPSGGHATRVSTETSGECPPVARAGGDLQSGARSSLAAYDQHAYRQVRLALYRCPVRCLGSSAGFTKVIPQGPTPCTCKTVSSLVRK